MYVLSYEDKNPNNNHSRSYDPYDKMSELAAVGNMFTSVQNTQTLTCSFPNNYVCELEDD